jgi:hypothetical protein
LFLPASTAVNQPPRLVSETGVPPGAVRSEVRPVFYWRNRPVTGLHPSLPLYRRKSVHQPPFSHNDFQNAFEPAVFAGTASYYQNYFQREFSNSEYQSL